jgi:predicted phosphodiesterase
MPKMLVLSDTHFGDPRVNDLLVLHQIYRVIVQEQPGVLVLAGDVLEGKLARAETVAQLKAICRQVPVVVVLRGNHDSAPLTKFAEELPALIGDAVTGAQACTPFALEHGHRFDSWWKRVPGLGRLSIGFQHLVYRAFGWDLQGWFRRFKWVQRKLLRQHIEVRDAWLSRILVISGHTHLLMSTPSGYGYFNSGDWVQHRSYVVVDSGKARLVEVNSCSAI